MNFIDKYSNFTVQLQLWFELNQRELPWRKTKDPYKIWLSEIILQQTRVAQGLSYYLKFIEHYPTVEQLAEASEEEVLKDWQGLGYYSRARNLHFAAKYISRELKGQFPSSYATIRQLKGVGDYTAAAIASFSFDLPHAVIDGNVYRVLSRIFGVEIPIDSTEGKKAFKEIALKLLDHKDPATHNQAIMEFGALQCTPKNPDCNSCPFTTDCYAFNNQKWHLLPIKKKKIKQRVRFMNYLIFENEDSMLVNYRNEKGIWQNLYDFPMIETPKEVNESQLLSELHSQELLLDQNYRLVASSDLKKHILSHQILKAKFFHFRISDFSSLERGKFQIISKQKLKNLPIPKLIENYLKQETNLLSLLSS